MTLLDKDAKIVVNAGANNRTGQHWDPDNIVARVLRKPKWGQVGR